MQGVLLDIIEFDFKKKYKQNIVPNICDKEHIRPETWNEKWEKLDKHSEIISYLGNLYRIETTLNGELSDKSFLEKVKILEHAIKKRDNFITNSTLDFFDYIKEKNINNWNLKAIQNRSRYLSKILSKRLDIKKL